ncbi:MAG: hemin ABC transporter ATP binding protein [Osedax symbiont Rs1]|nr:MAG: hemin ABC transporter ATP binding protein [Osedax symbiont Rs1]
MSLVLKNIGLTINGKTLIENINLTVTPGEVLAILGPNGAGKSTVFKVMAGEYRHFSGAMTINGQTYQGYSSNRRAKMIGVLPQSSELAFPFSAYEVVMLGRLPHSTGRKKDHQIAVAAMQQLDVLKLADALYPALSGGEKQRVQLARVLCQIWQAANANLDAENRYLLLDEPTSALDLSHQHQTLSLARELAASGMGVLCILHDLNLAAQYADKILMLSAGKVMSQGSVSEVLTSERIARLYGIDVTVIPHPKHNHPLVITG